MRTSLTPNRSSSYVSPPLGSYKNYNTTLLRLGNFTFPKIRVVRSSRRGIITSSVYRLGRRGNYDDVNPIEDEYLSYDYAYETSNRVLHGNNENKYYVDDDKEEYYFERKYTSKEFSDNRRGRLSQDTEEEVQQDRIDEKRITMFVSVLISSLGKTMAAAVSLAQEFVPPPISRKLVANVTKSTFVLGCIWLAKMVLEALLRIGGFAVFAIVAISSLQSLRLISPFQEEFTFQDGKEHSKNGSRRNSRSRRSNN